MLKLRLSIPLTKIIFDEEIYPRTGIDHKRVAMFTENLRDGHPAKGGIEAFRQNAHIGKCSKYRFEKRFHCPTGSRKTRLARTAGLVRGFGGQR